MIKRKTKNFYCHAEQSEASGFAGFFTSLRCVQNDNYRRTGSALLVVLGIVMAITILSLAFLSRSDVELSCGENMALRTKCDYLAESALEHARGLLLNPQEIDGEYWTGDTSGQLDSGSDYYYDVAVSPNQPASGVTRWCNYDINCEAYRSIQGQRTARSSLKAVLRLDPCIAYWSDSSFDRQLSSAVTINGDVYFADDLSCFGAMNGDVFCRSLSLSGSKTGQQKDCGDLSLEWPRVIAADFTCEYAVQSVSSPLSSQTLGPYSPARVFQHTGDMVLAGDVEIHGMLIVEGDLTVQGTDNFIIAQKNLPALLVTGDVKIVEDSDLDIQGLAVIDGDSQTNVGCEDVNVLGGLFVKDGLWETTKDSSANGSDAVVLNDPTWLPSGGWLAGTVRFDGANDKIEQYDAPAYLNGRSAITVSLWVKSDVTNQDRGIFFTRPPTGADQELGLRYDRNGAFGGATSCIKASIQTSSGYTQIESTSSVQTTGWQHLALTWQSGQSLKLYINGVENLLTYDGGPLAGTITGVQKFMLGCDTKSCYWDGLIDDVRIYNRVLDSNDIYPPKEGLTGQVAHWRLDEDGQREIVITAAPAKSAVWLWSAASVRQKWSQAETAFYKDIRRN